MKDLKDITEEEVRDICEIYNEPYISYMAGKWTYGLAVQINTTTTADYKSRHDSYITIYYDGRIRLRRNTGDWNGMSDEDINPLIVIDYLRKLGYEFKYKLPLKLERKIKLKTL